jgi:hypothetical protein
MAERRDWVRWISKISAAVAIVAMVFVGVGVGRSMLTKDDSQQATQTSTPPERIPPSKRPSVPVAKEFTIDVVVTQTNCQPAGDCAYVYSIDPKYIGFHPLPETPFTVEYEVRGGHQPQPGKFTVDGEQAQITTGVTVEGPPGAELKAVVTNVTG